MFIFSTTFFPNNPLCTQNFEPRVYFRREISYGYEFEGSYVWYFSDDITGNQSVSWWRHQMETFFALLAICAGNSSVPGEFPTQRPVTRSFAVFFDLRLNKQLSIQSWGWWFDTLSRPLWRNFNGVVTKKCLMQSTKMFISILITKYNISSTYILTNFWRYCQIALTGQYPFGLQGISEWNLITHLSRSVWLAPIAGNRQLEPQLSFFSTNLDQV